MPTFHIYTEQSMGFRHSGGDVFSEGAGEVDLTDEEVQQLITLINDNYGETDVEVLELEEKYPDIYEKLDEAYRSTAIDARYRQLYMELFEGGYLDEPVDDIVKFCEENHGFVFEYDEDDYRDPETGELDEDMLENDKNEYFWRDWIDDYYDSLSDDEKVSFITSHYDLDDVVVDDYDYDVEIPEEIVKMAAANAPKEKDFVMGEDVHDQIASISDSVRDDIEMIVASASSRDFRMEANKRFWKVYEAALKVRAILEEQSRRIAKETQSCVDWAGIEKFRGVIDSGLPVMMTNPRIYSDYAAQMNQFFIKALSL